MDETQTLEALSNLLTEISSNPYDIALHAKHIKLSVESGSEEQVNAARQMMTGFWPAGDEVWLPLINSRIQQGVDTLDDVMEVIGLFEIAEEDYLCEFDSTSPLSINPCDGLATPLLQKHLEFLIDRYSHFNSSESESEEMNGMLPYDVVKPMLYKIVGRGSGHLTQVRTSHDAATD